MARIFALVIGTFFFVVGVTGLIQEPLVPDGLLHDLLAVNPAHDLVRLALGALAVLAYATGWSRTYCWALGICLLLAGLPGLVQGPESTLLGLDMNPAIAVLYLIVGVAALAGGFASRYDRRIFREPNVG